MELLDITLSLRLRLRVFRLAEGRQVFHHQAKPTREEDFK
ncbi:hypothetical protein I553_3495 [Mycobacterium xenopi 4042]|uniref:Uncharacterized protein n=1 Tax=Mycobacterium xenopi 4042 TaxID=1299334 RepID=X7ZWM6_MYCXE|nr:hypothetical protein I553_3495 [Mycobacterium xenopi 4042]